MTAGGEGKQDDRGVPPGEDDHGASGGGGGDTGGRGERGWIAVGELF